MTPSDCLRTTNVRCLLLIVAALCFTGCGTRSVDRSAALLESPVQTDSAYCLQQMQQSTGDRKTSWQLLAIRSLLRESKHQQAGALFSRLPVKLDAAQRQERSLLAVELKLAQNDIAGAQALLAKTGPSGFRGKQLSRYRQCMVAVQQGKPSPALLRALMAQAPLLTTMQEKQRNIDATWQVLITMPQEYVDSLNHDADSTDEQDIQGWLALRHVWSDNRGKPDGMKAGIRSWQKRWPQHPASEVLPSRLVRVMHFRSSSVSKIALMLPLSGQAARFGRVIYQGFEAGKYMSSPPLGGAPALLVYDTSTKPVTQLLSLAKKDGATLVVGPLLKHHVRELLSSNTGVDVLALNLPENPVFRDNVCYFALSPEDEARNAARHIRQQGKRFPLLLLPEGELSERVSGAFTQEWQKRGGGVVLAQRFGSVAGLKSGVNSGEGISLTGTPVIIHLPQQQPVREVVALHDSNGSFRRGQVDAVYIIATPQEMAYLRPMIEMRNGSRSGAMLYASSRSISSAAGPDFRLDMEGLQFSDIPALTGGNPGLKKRAMKAAHNDDFLARLYAMGADARMLANHFSQIRQMPGFTLDGNTGELSATSDCVISRELPWFRYRQGQIIPAG